MTSATGTFKRPLCACPKVATSTRSGDPTL
jgi:hypothetical protein